MNPLVRNILNTFLTNHWRLAIIPWSIYLYVYIYLYIYLPICIYILIIACNQQIQVGVLPNQSCLCWGESGWHTFALQVTVKTSHEKHLNTCRYCGHKQNSICLMKYICAKLELYDLKKWILGHSSLMSNSHVKVLKHLGILINLNNIFKRIGGNTAGLPAYVKREYFPH